MVDLTEIFEKAKQKEAEEQAQAEKLPECLGCYFSPCRCFGKLEKTEKIEEKEEPKDAT